jgi:putative transposase
MTSSKIDLEAEISKCTTMEDLTGKNGLVQRLLGSAIENMLETEMGGHLGYEKHSPIGNHSGNSRNGKSTKSVRSSYGDLEIKITRDRNGTFSPKLVLRQAAIFGLKIV